MIYDLGYCHRRSLSNASATVLDLPERTGKTVLDGPGPFAPASGRLIVPAGWHRHSKISFVATGVICGLGPYGYIAAMHAIARMK